MKRKKKEKKHDDDVCMMKSTVRGLLVYWSIGCNDNIMIQLTSKVLDADKTADWHQCVMIHMQSGDLALFFSQYKEYGIQ